MGYRQVDHFRVDLVDYGNEAILIDFFALWVQKYVLAVHQGLSGNLIEIGLALLLRRSMVVPSGRLILIILSA